MALPTVDTLFDCSSFSKTVLPFLPQLRELPYRILESYNDLEALKTIYITTNPLITALAFSLFISPIFLVVSEINRNYSQVDRCWSILPSIYNVHYGVWAHLTGMHTQRLDNIMAFSITWSLRLTYNYWRKGGYSIGSEDYRWEVLRTKISAPLFFLFNIAFISFAQSILLFLITTPVYVMLLTTLIKTAEVMSTADIVWVRILMGFILVEWFADQSQWKYYKAKKSYQETAKAPHGYPARSLDLGFNTLGLFSYSRHPNFAAEQAIWVGLYQWGCWTSSVLFNWTFAGSIGYLLLFQASTWFTELITLGKYPEYKEYQKLVGKFVPKVGSVVSLFTDDDAPASGETEQKGKKDAVTKGKQPAKGGKTGIERDQPRRGPKR